LAISLTIEGLGALPRLSIEIIRFLSDSSSNWVNLWLLAHVLARNVCPVTRSCRVERGTLNRRAASRRELISLFFIAYIANKRRPS
jgi:hypothetical protein